MAAVRTKKEKPFYGRVMESRRAFLGKKSAMDIENETQGVIYQKLLYRIEGGDKDPFGLDLTEFSALLKALEWTPEDFARETKLTLPKAFQNLPKSDNIAVSKVPSEIRVVPFYRLRVPRQGEGVAVRGNDKPIMLEATLTGDFELYRVEAEDLEPVSYIVRLQTQAARNSTVICEAEGLGTIIAKITAIEGAVYALTDLRGQTHLVKNPTIKGVATSKLVPLEIPYDAN